MLPSENDANAMIGCNKWECIFKKKLHSLIAFVSFSFILLLLIPPTVKHGLSALDYLPLTENISTFPSV